MNEQDQAPNETPVALVKKNTLTQILGRVEASANVEGKGAANNTRWVFDILAQGSEAVEVQILEFRSGRSLKPDLMSLSITPLSESCWDARLYGEIEEGKVTLRCKKDAPRHSYRVAIDVMHSATR